MFLFVGMIVTEQVEHAVGEQELKFGLHGVTGRLCLICNHSGAQHDVAEDARLRIAFDEFVHRETQDIGRSGLVHPLHVQLCHTLHVNYRNGQLTLRMKTQGRDQKLCLRLQSIDVNGVATGVVDFDGQFTPAED